MIKTIVIAAAGVGATLAVVACGGPPGPASFVGSGGSYVDFISGKPPPAATCRAR